VAARAAAEAAPERRYGGPNIEWCKYQGYCLDTCLAAEHSELLAACGPSSAEGLAGCAPDADEPNEGYDGAAALGPLPLDRDGLTVCGGRDWQDVYRLRIEPGLLYYLELRSGPAAFDLSLTAAQLLDDGSTLVLGPGLSAGSVDLFVLDPADARHPLAVSADEYLVLVEATHRWFWPQSYGLSIAAFDGEIACGEQNRCPGKLVCDAVNRCVVCSEAQPCPDGLQCQDGRCGREAGKPARRDGPPGAAPP